VLGRQQGRGMLLLVVALHTPQLAASDATLHRCQCPLLFPGLKKPAEFFKIQRKPAESGQSEFKNHEIIVHCFKISEKNKNQQNIYTN
jgi:hypothetical protein